MTSKNSLPGFNLKFFQILYHCLKIRKALKLKSTATKAQAAQTQLATHGGWRLQLGVCASHVIQLFHLLLGN